MTFAVTSGAVASSYIRPITTLKAWYDFTDTGYIVKAYNNISATGSGTSGTKIITASTSVANIVQTGMIIRIGGTDTYTVSTVSTTTITTVQTLTSTYTAGSALALDQISQMTDKSGNGNHLTEGTNSKKLVYTPNIINGLSVGIANGANVMVMPSGLFSLPNGNNTVFVVCKRNTETGVQQYIITLSHALSARWHLRYAGTAGSIAFWNGAAAPGTEIAKTGNINTNFQIIQGLRNGTTLGVAVNNSAATTNTNASNATDVDGGFLASLSDGSAWLIGAIAEVRIYNSTLSGKQVMTINKELSTKYNIAIA